MCLKLGTSLETLNKFNKITLNNLQLFLAKAKYRCYLSSSVFDVSNKFGTVFPWGAPLLGARGNFLSYWHPRTFGEFDPGTFATPLCVILELVCPKMGLIYLSFLFTPHNSSNNNDFCNLLNLATKESLFTFKNKFYIQRDGVAMGSPLGPIFANIFL